MKTPNNITKDGHCLHFFTSNDEIVLSSKGAIHVCPMQANPKGIICYLLKGKWFALPLEYRPQLFIK